MKYLLFELNVLLCNEQNMVHFYVLFWELVLKMEHLFLLIVYLMELMQKYLVFLETY